MTTTDKTREKLMASMRKTKSSTDEGEAAKKPTAAVAPAKPKKAASRKRAAAKSKTTTKKKPTAKKAARKNATLAGADPYQGGRRVWPD